jgi:hypothetical protein
VDAPGPALAGALRKGMVAAARRAVLREVVPMLPVGGASDDLLPLIHREFILHSSPCALIVGA